MKLVKLTKAAIDKMPTPPLGERIDYFDSELKGFGMRVSNTKKRFFVMKRVKGKLTRVMLKEYGCCTPTEARKEATKTLSMLHDGIDVNAERAKEILRGMTLGEALKSYFETKTLKPRTVENYTSLFHLYLGDWLNKPIAYITKDMVATRHARVTREHGQAAANNVILNP